jgi:hypothetical protein
MQSRVAFDFCFATLGSDHDVILCVVSEGEDCFGARSTNTRAIPRIDDDTRLSSIITNYDQRPSYFSGKSNKSKSFRLLWIYGQDIMRSISIVEEQ